MIELPISEHNRPDEDPELSPNRSTPAAPAPRPLARIVMHGLRVALLIAVAFLIHHQHQQRQLKKSMTSDPPPLDAIQHIFPKAAHAVSISADPVRWLVSNSKDEELGILIKTSPTADKVIGFSGPTNVLIGFDDNQQIQGVAIESSGDTREHLRQVVEDESFLQFWDGLSWEEAGRTANVDAVSGATLTSLAIAESVLLRLGGNPPSLKFPDPVSIQLAKELFPDADDVAADETVSGRWLVNDASGDFLGTIVRTSPATDNLVGYQGPTETLIGIDPAGEVVGLRVGNSFDNEPYVSYVRDEAYFLELFNGSTLKDLAELDLVEEQIEGVSGATMTSMSVAEGLIVTAKNQLRQQESQNEKPTKSPTLRMRDWGTIAIIVAGLALGLSKWRGKSGLRIPFQIVLIIYLGFINGDLLSQSMLVGWAKNGVPVWSAFGLVAVSAVAFFFPMTTKSNVYCGHLCPHGAIQQLVRNRLPWKLRLSRRWTQSLSLIPSALLIWVVLVAMTGWAYSLVDIEPFDAYLYDVAGWATMTIAIVGIIVSLFVPMGYCRFGCPTGAMLDYLRFNRRSDRFRPADIVAMFCLLLAVVLASI